MLTREEIARVIDESHPPQLLGSYARALWIADALLPLLRAEVDKWKERAFDAEGREASLVDLANSWAREEQVEEARRRRAEREGLERAVEIVSTFVARDIAAFNAGRADNPLWTTALAEACGPVLRQLAARLRREIEGAGR